MVAARRLANREAEVHVLLTGEAQRLKNVSVQQWCILDETELAVARAHKLHDADLARDALVATTSQLYATEPSTLPRACTVGHDMP